MAKRSALRLRHAAWRRDKNKENNPIVAEHPVAATVASCPPLFSARRGKSGENGAETRRSRRSGLSGKAASRACARPGGSKRQARARATMSRTSGDSVSCAATLSSASRASARRPGFQIAPGAERRQQPRGDLRIDLVELQRRVGDETIARAVGGVEAGRIAVGEGADQRVDAIGIGEAEGVTCGQALHPGERLRLGDRRLQREPFVDDQRLAGVASGRRNPAPARAAPWRGPTAPRARPSGRSCWSPVWNWRMAISAPSAGAAGRIEVEAGVAQRAAAGAGGVGRIGRVRRQPVIDGQQARAEQLADVGAQRLCAPGRWRRDRRPCRCRGRCRFRSAARPFARRRPGRPRRPRCAAPSASAKSGLNSGNSPARISWVERIISRVAKLCAACQRLNGSLSWAIISSRSSSPRSTSRITGAEKRRFSEGTGLLGTSLNTIRRVRVGQFENREFGFALARRHCPGPAGFPRRRGRSGRCRIGISSGFFSGWPGVGGVSCDRSSV